MGAKLLTPSTTLILASFWSSGAHALLVYFTSGVPLGNNVIMNVRRCLLEKWSSSPRGSKATTSFCLGNLPCKIFNRNLKVLVLKGCLDCQYIWAARQLLTSSFIYSFTPKTRGESYLPSAKMLQIFFDGAFDSRNEGIYMVFSQLYLSLFIDLQFTVVALFRQGVTKMKDSTLL